MSESGGGVVGADFRVGAVLGKTFGVFFKRIVTFGAIAIGVQIPTMVISLLFFGDILSAVDSGDPSQLEEASFGFEMGGSGHWALQLVSMLLQILVTAAVVYGTIRSLRGGGAGIVECITGGLGRLLPAAGVTLLFVVMISAAIGVPAFLVGLFEGGIAGLLLIPALALVAYLFVIFYTAIPAVVTERPGVLGAFSRSLELTKGSRWRIFGLMLAVLAIMIVASIVIWMPLGLMSAFVGLSALTLVGFVVNALLTVFLVVVMTVAYHDLRIAHEGVDSDEIAAVFD